MNRFLDQRLRLTFALQGVYLAFIGAVAAVVSLV
jgi:hypothetical protein